MPARYRTWKSSNKLGCRGYFSHPFSQHGLLCPIGCLGEGVLTSIAIEIASTDLIQHWSKIKHMIGSIGISLGKRLRQPCIVPIDVIVEIHMTLFIHSCGCVQDQHGNR